MARVIIEQSPGAVAARAAEHVSAAVRDAGGPFTIGLAGGSTPTETHRLLARADIDWSNVSLWLGDERWVPHDDPDSNAGMARRTLAGAVGAEVVAPDTSLPTPAEAAADYERRLQEIWVERDGIAAPDLVMLGIGDDGHTASLFPGTAALGETERSYVENWVADKGVWRLTATLPLLWSARTLLFVVVGEAKAGVVGEIIDDDVPYPAHLVSSRAADVIWVLDSAAASRLGRV
ncbi:MAG TPA: 6-phosphogluconolactonase [Acidimicrobiia bacterium]